MCVCVCVCVCVSLGDSGGGVIGWCLEKEDVVVEVAVEEAPEAMLAACMETKRHTHSRDGSSTSVLGLKSAHVLYLKC